MPETVDEDCTSEDFSDAVFADQEWEGRCFAGCRFTGCGRSRARAGSWLRSSGRSGEPDWPFGGASPLPAHSHAVNAPSRPPLIVLSEQAQCHRQVLRQRTTRVKSYA
ncbi:MAG: hypothetical protein ACRDRW_04940 [Pseudonocardiaceae bacterium]